ncbi:MAG: hypothetical protein LH679_16805 [Cyanobacteria bacterium CAN_BIN43]|nr:hypothetical protein [Cyanobacteria bacterium CAN_BIN43]
MLESYGNSPDLAFPVASIASPQVSQKFGTSASLRIPSFPSTVYGYLYGFDYFVLIK